MAFIPVSDTVAVDVVYDWDGQIVENTLYYKKDSPTTTEVASLIDQVTAFIRDEIMPLLHETISLIRVIGTLLDVVDGFTVTNTTDLPQAGAILDATAKSLPNNVSFAISFRTAASGRSGRGRNFVAGLADVRDGNNLLDLTYQGQLVTAWSSLSTVAVDDGWEQVVVSRFHAGAPRVAGVTNTVTSVIATDRTLDSQRRRLPGRGT